MCSQALTDVYTGRIIAITGATGFIGARLLRRICDASPQAVRILTRSSSSLELVQDLSATPMCAPLEDPKALDQALEGVDYVFHLAGLTRAKTRAELFAVNAHGTRNLAESVARVAPNVKRVLHVSSQAAWGPNPLGVDAVKEGDEPRPVTWYGESKLASETSLIEGLNEVPWSIVRPPGVYGPGEKDFLSMFRMVKSRFSPMIGFGEKHYSLVYSDDLVEAILSVAASDATINRSYFAAEPRVHSNMDLMHAIENAVGRKAWKPRLPELLVRGLAAFNSLFTPLLRRPPLLNNQKVKELLPDRWVVATEQLKADTGYECSTTLADGTQKTADWYKEKGWL